MASLVIDADIDVSGADRCALRYYRREDFFLHDQHARRYVNEQRWMNRAVVFLQYAADAN